ncbi:MAG: succinate dehydrogenase assembly factor 2 [Alphaproteobacteria bacterium]|nr:succinate dehydrogenase assembly factor 2 [Alphaproteobacteria bacterium]
MDVLDRRRKRLIFRADHRGTKEMDLLLGSFAKKYVPNFSEQELEEFEDLLTHNDPDLYNWITGKEEAPEDTRRMSFFQKLVEFKLS